MTKLQLSDRVNEMQPSMTLGMAQAARDLTDQGVDVVVLSAGEPDFTTPQSIRDVAKASLDKGKTHYVPVRGTKAMVAALQKKFAREQKVDYSPDEVMVTVGAKSAIFLALQALLNQGDEVILCAPYWVSYHDQIKLAGGIPVVVQCRREEDFMPRGDKIAKVITKKTKAIILNSPNNPSGGVISKAQLDELADVVRGTDIWIISDEIYEKLLFDDAIHYSPASLNDDMQKRTIVISGASKAYAMTGFRVGVVAGNKSIIGAMVKLQGQQATCLPEFIQDAAALAFLEPPEVSKEVGAMIRAYQDRRDFALKAFAQWPQVNLYKPKGAFYMWADFSFYLSKRFVDDIALAEAMLKEAHVATVPGTPFGGPGFLRFSIASSQTDLEKAAIRLGDWLKAIT